MIHISKGDAKRLIQENEDIIKEKTKYLLRDLPKFKSNLTKLQIQNRKTQIKIYQNIINE